MNLNLTKYSHLRRWFFSHVLVMLVFTLYATFFSSYSLHSLSDKAILTVGGLSLYQFCALMWLSAYFERVESKFVIPAAIFAFLMWHYSFWGELAMFGTDLTGGTGGDPSKRLFDKQATVLYLYLFGWGYVITKAITHKFYDLKIMALSGGVILAILVGYHLVGYWSLFDQGDRYIYQSDNKQIQKLVSTPDTVFDEVCRSIYGLDCYRFEKVDGYPSELYNYNAAHRNEIVSLADNPISSDPNFRHSYIQRDTLFEDNYSDYYSRTFYFDQRDGVVNYVISDYFGDIPVNYLHMTCWMLVIAGIFWNWIVVGIGVEHSAQLQPRSRKKANKTTFTLSLLFILALGPFLAWYGFDYFFSEHKTILFGIFISFGVALIIKKKILAVLFLTTSSFLIAPSIYMYVVGLSKAYGVVNGNVIEVYSWKGMWYTVLSAFILVPSVIYAVKGKFEYYKETLVLALAILISGVFFIYVGTHIIFPTLLSDSEAIRVNHITQSGSDFVNYCQWLDFDICRTVNNPNWKWEFLTPFVNSIFYMLVAGVVVICSSLFLLTCYAHRVKN